MTNDTNHASDVFLRDLLTGTNVLVSVNTAGTSSANDASFYPVMTPDARFVAFLSRATNLTAEGADLRLFENVYVRDLRAGTTRLVSVTTKGTAAGLATLTPPAISADGRYVAFGSASLALGTFSGGTRFFVRDLVTGITTTPSVFLSPHGDPTLVGITPDGRLVAWEAGWLLVYSSGATNVVKLDARAAQLSSLTPDGRWLAWWSGPPWSLRTYDLATGASNVVVSVNPPTNPHWGEFRPALSDDGRYAAFATDAGGLSSQPTNGFLQVYLADLQTTNTIRLISINAAATGPGNGRSGVHAISSDGGVVVFRSDATDLVTGGVTGGGHLYARDWRVGSTTLLTGGASGHGADGISFTPVRSIDRGIVAFVSGADDLLAGGSSEGLDVFAAQLPVELAPPHLSATLLAVGSGIEISWYTNALATYGVEYKSRLLDPQWQPLPGLPLPGALGRFKVEDAGAAAGGQRYYRVVGRSQ